MKTKNYARLLSTGMLCTLMCGTLQAQETEFDLASQRSEIQNVLPVPGHKADHGGYIINPTPHRFNLLKEGSVAVDRGFAWKGQHDRFSTSTGFLTADSRGTALDIRFGAKAARKAGVKPLSGAYALQVGQKGIAITGYDERGVFYALQTLRELLHSPATAAGRLSFMEINDYPDLPNRGVVEGFYGNPWSHEVRLSLIDFYGKSKMNTYLYGPKDDPYHSCPNWRLPYPEKEARQIKELIDACNRNYVDFVWAIHPGQDIRWNEEDYNNLIRKFNIMYDLGVRHFAVFFDDISGEGTNPLKQTELLNRLTREFVKAKGDVSPLTVCPTDYSKLWAKPGEDGPLAIYGRTLDPDIKVFWTGDVVCSDLTPETLDFINSRIRRPAYYWWNYPVTDYARHILMQGPVYGLDTRLTANETCGVVSNPMEHGEASKLALYGVADYTWNTAAYNAMDNWERGLEVMVPQAAEAYRTFAIHSCDTETGYRRDESWETRTFTLDRWDDAAAEALREEFRKVEKARSTLEEKCTNKALLNELRPWLTEFEKLGVRGQKAIELGGIFRKGGDDALFWSEYVGNRMSDADRKAYEAHKSGTMKLQPFYEKIMDDMGHRFLKRLSGKTPTDYVGIGSFDNSGTILTKQMLDNDSTTHYTSGMPQREGDWIGVDLRDEREVSEIFILQGRNSVDDVDYFDHAALECSRDGKTWVRLIDDMQKQYVIRWQGEPQKARYVRIKRLESAKKNYAAVRLFAVNPLHPRQLGFAIEAADPQQALRAFDNNPSTAYSCNGELTFEVKAPSYVLLLDKVSEPLKCIVEDAQGNPLSEQTITTPYFRLETGEQAARIRLTGRAEIFEVVAQ